MVTISSKLLKSEASRQRRPKEATNVDERLNVRRTDDAGLVSNAVTRWSPVRRKLQLWRPKYLSVGTELSVPIIQ